MCRGCVTSVDEDHDHNTLWQIRYDADGKEEDFDTQQMLKHVIHREDGESPPDGGMSARLRAEAAAHELCVPQQNPAENSAENSAVVPVSSPESGGGEASKGTNQTSTSGKPFEAYETQSDDSWATILKNTGVTIHQQRDFLRWLQKHFNIGTFKECKRA